MIRLGSLRAVAVLLTLATELLAANCRSIFANGFEEGAVCEWGPGCDFVPFRVVAAAATSGSSVAVCFNHAVDGLTLSGNGAQFAFDNGLSAASATWDGRTIGVGTSSQGAGIAYTVTVRRCAMPGAPGPLSPPAAARSKPQ